MDLTGRFVRFHLSGDGRKALRGLVAAKGSFQALVVATADLGPLVSQTTSEVRQGGQTVPVMLVRWDYIAAMTFDLALDRAPAREAIGFTPD